MLDILDKLWDIGEEAADVIDWIGGGIVEGGGNLEPIADAVGNGIDWGGVAKAATPIVKALSATINTPYGAAGGPRQRAPLQQLGNNMMPINGNGPGRSGQSGQNKTTSYEDWRANWDRRMAALLQANNDAGLSATVSRNRIYGRKRR